MPSTNGRSLLLAAAATLLLACGSNEAAAPGSPTAVTVAAGATAGTAVVSFTAPTSGDAPTGYTVTANPGGITASGTSSPITISGLAAQTAYTYGVVATNGAGASAPATTGALRFFDVVETFHEPMTQPNDTIFTGTFTFDTTSKTVSNLAGTLTQAMTMMPPMTTVTLAHQLFAAPTKLGGVDGLLVATFALSTTDTFDPCGFTPGGTQYFGLSAGAPSAKNGGVGNAYAMIFVNTNDPTAALAQAQLDKLAYADCTAGGMMGATCMTGTAVAGYGREGTMMAVPVSQVTTER
jgi:hypothetical protein